MGLVKPDLPGFDLDDWAARPEAERVPMMCRSWAEQGFGAPVGAYAFYVLKLALYAWLWTVFASRTPGFGGLAHLSRWWSQPVAFEKAIVWTLLFEILGLGCGSGPLTGRYVPPIVACTHFARPGTTRLPPWPTKVPLTKGFRRTVVDALLYLAVIGLALALLLDRAPLLPRGPMVVLVAVLAVLGLRDKTVFLAARAEHYWTMLIVFVLAGHDVRVLLAGGMVVQLAIWWGAATSKLNHHFPNVVTIMVSNSPVIRLRAVRRAMYRHFPDDLRASRLAAAFAHGGTAVEYLFPLVLALSRGGVPTDVALGVMLAFHLFITSCFPMGVPIEWNVLFLYSMFALFGAHSSIAPWHVLHDPLLAALLVAGLLAGPVYGSFRPDRVSFLPGMRYYAGNWAASLWLFRKHADGTAGDTRLDEHLTKTARTVSRQLDRLYDEDTIRAVNGKLRAFRSMHLHGRALNALLPLAVADVGGDLEAYDVNEGEGLCGVVLGWNFGDGHLHHEQLLEAVQAQCRFEPGELRCIFLESQPLPKPWMHWRIVDAATGRLDEGHVRVADLLAHQPWPDQAAAGTIDLHVRI